MNEKMTKEELLKKAMKPNEDAMKLHPFYRGKIEVNPKACVRSFDDFAIWYTPGVAAPCKEIAKDKELVFKHTNKWNAVAVVSDGTRVLGLGNIGPEAGLPVMEGKAMLFKYLGGVDAYPLCLDTRDPDDIIKTVKLLKPSFGGINLEDIEKPKCFYILDTLRADPEMDIPVWHDDQQGTATIVVAGAINALKLAGKKIKEASIAMVGAGAANIAISRVLIAAGATKGNIIMVDSQGILNAQRKDLEKDKKNNPLKWDMAVNSNKEQRSGSIKDALKGADICLAASKPGPGTIIPDQVRGMADKAIVFATANPVPEIWPWEAKEAGAYIVATGRSDFPNQINNSLGFPGIFRGTLDVMAKTITDEMCIAAALELAQTAEDNGIHEEYVVPTMDEWEVFPREAVAVGLKAIEQGIARRKASRQTLMEEAMEIIKKSRGQTQLLMDEGYIPEAPE
ncbi:MAG: NADP-dependent malic enzyme [Theionarchaea archaeon]|nr:NADP-dependent malic enzyme [Theionarchaea archaeon]MBU7001971.1 NADP-dependent malic enzyme [Theionarchaea archaeon]MBU7019778.1 NADP-dependent malic enzyme [Theionarchaea archaeon]MBU7034602.1 NADP-dependent malic enzyme [Theionarchaea archaeon]MBU7041308.1 NADP-dependent malic enzyme [Theionarchaea archaeon]